MSARPEVRPLSDSNQLPVGTRVSAVIYCQERIGTVVGQKSDGIVFVRWDGQKRIAWSHRMSLTPIEAPHA